MSQVARFRPLHLLTLLVLVLLVSACGRGTRADAARAAANAPTAFDVTLIAEKDEQFDFQGVPLTAQDLRAALNYRKEQSLPMSTVLLKRGEKARIKNTHIVALARIAVSLGFTAYIDDEGTINEIQTTTKSVPVE